jgi:hypothetical protein
VSSSPAAARPGSDAVVTSSEIERLEAIAIEAKDGRVVVRRRTA